MGILRTDVISHSQISNGNASVLFDGTADRLTIPSHSAFAFGTADWTVEGWFYFTSITGQQTLVGDTYGNTAGFYLYKQSNHRLGVYYSSLLVDGTATIEADRWYHFAFVRNSGRTRIYINGELDADGADTTDATITQYYIADTATTSGEFFGNISNLRITRTAVYKTNFTVPKFKLKEIPGTILLCCQSSSSTTEATVSVPGTLTTGGDPTATAFGPGLKEDITDTGVVFDGVTTFDSQAYMVPPGGNTRERNRGRGIIAGGCTPTISEISFFNIQSQGNSSDFGHLHSDIFGNQMCSSSTRGINGGGAQPGVQNVLDFITISTESNSTDFGDLTSARRDIGALSNETRGMWTGGNPGSSPNATDTIDFVTIATLGDASDFGNLTASMKEVQSASSPTRGIMGGGSTVPANVNTIQFITIASAGNASDFGDLTRTAASLGAVSNGTRGVFANGGSNTIDFVTIASAGNATDFGDSTVLRAQCTATMSNSIRGVFAGGYQPSPNSTDTNTVDFITIATTGNATDFGDISRDNNDSNRENGGCSDSHGGLS